MAHIDVICKSDGTVELKPTGYTGPTCLAATKALEADLGMGADAKRTKTREFVGDQVKAGTVTVSGRQR